MGAQIFEKEGILYGLLWVAVTFVSILVHELGHALAFRRYGAAPYIVLYSLGGLAISLTAEPRWRQRIAISLAGPFAGFILAGLLYGSNLLNPWIGPDTPRPLSQVFEWLWFVNFWWGLMNLLPVWPLDGGNISKEICLRFSPRNGQRISLMISVGFAGLVCLFCLGCYLNGHQIARWMEPLFGWFPFAPAWPAILFGLLAIQSYLFLQQLQKTDRYWHDSDRVPWER
jgi:Zn-dependent protease